MVSVMPQELKFPVEIEGSPDSVFAGYFYPSLTARRRILQVLVHGNSYDHRYWDVETVNGQDYSYAQFMTAQGFDLLAIDLPGVGASSKPHGHSVRVEAVGRALSTLVESLRGPNAIPGYEFDHIAVVGHSMGAAIAVFAEANWPAADSLVVTATGYFQGRATSGWAPGVREALLENDYALVPPELRLGFYHAPQADPGLVTYDNEVLRTSAPSGLWADCIAMRDDPKSGVGEVTCPVYVQLGEHDPVMAGEYAEQEAKCYTASSDVVIEQLPDIGHCFNLHLNRAHGWRRICDYFDRKTVPVEG